MARQALDDVLKGYPDFQPSEHPDMTRWTTSAEPLVSQIPWTVEEILARLIDESWIQRKEFLGPDCDGFVRAVADEASLNFEWGLDLADKLAAADNWDTDLWIALFHAWRKTDFDSNQCHEILRRFSRTKLQLKHVRPIADFLYAFGKDDDRQYTDQTLTQANDIAANLWSLIDPNEPIGDDHDWLTRAINHPAGVLAQFWLTSLSSWLRRQDPISEGLGVQYREAFSLMVQDRTSAGRLGRCVLAGHLSFLLAVDENWAR